MICDNLKFLNKFFQSLKLEIRGNLVKFPTKSHFGVILLCTVSVKICDFRLRMTKKKLKIMTNGYYQLVMAKKVKS